MNGENLHLSRFLIRFFKAVPGVVIPDQGEINLISLFAYLTSIAVVALIQGKRHSQHHTGFLLVILWVK
jgi:hypothetical protein